MNALKSTIQENSPHLTQCSMLFDPANAEVFIVLKRDFSKVWKVSINDGTIETFKGSNSHQSFKIGDRGIPIKNLENISVNSNEKAANEDVKNGKSVHQKLMDVFEPPGNSFFQ